MGCLAVVMLPWLMPLLPFVVGMPSGRHECPGFDSCPDESALPGPLLGVRDHLTGDDLPRFGTPRVFPEGFEWGVGTAAYQIEGSYRDGGRGASIWDTFTGADTVGMPGALCSAAPCPVNAGMAAKGATGNVANAHYLKYKQDVTTMAGLGVATYRFSVSWPRVIPTGILADGVNREIVGQVEVPADTQDAHPTSLSALEQGLAFYHALVDDLLAQGIKPVLSIYHWDLPQGLLDANYDSVIPICNDLYRQGWFECEMGVEGLPRPRGRTAAIVRHFVDYAELLFREFAGKVFAFYTFNEPFTFTQLCCGWGHAPGVAPYTNQTIWPFVASHNVILAHLQAVIKFRELQDELPKLRTARIGIVLNSDWREPKAPCGPDIGAAVRAMEGMLGIFADPIWGRPDGRHDYPDTLRRLMGNRLPSFSDEEQSVLKANRPDLFGLNHYATSYAEACPFHDEIATGGQLIRRYNCSALCDAAAERECWTGSGVPDLVSTNGGAAGVGAENTVAISNEGLPQAQSVWLHQASWGFRKLLRYVNERYLSPQIFITENGVSAHADTPSDGQYDTARLLYLHAYLAALHTAIVEDGVRVGGYYAWSLMDNFEWGEGYRERFGLLFNDFNFCKSSPTATACDPNAPGAATPVYDPFTGRVSAACGAACLNTGVPDPRRGGEQTRHTKNSLAWLVEVWATNQLPDPTRYLFTASQRECWGEGSYSAAGYTAHCSMGATRFRATERRKSSIPFA